MTNVISFLNEVPDLPMVEHLELKYISFISWADDAVEALQNILTLPTTRRLKLTDTTFEDMEQFRKVFVNCGVNVDNVEAVHFHRLSIIKGKPMRSIYSSNNDSDEENASNKTEKEQSSP